MLDIRGVFCYIRKENKVSKFGWSLPAGCTTLPTEEEYPVSLKCPLCGRFISWEPLKYEQVRETFTNEQGKEELLFGDVLPIYGCSCGHKTRRPVEVYD